MSLRLIKNLRIRDYPGIQIGIMAHANTTKNFQEAYAAYPCENKEFCDAHGGPCPHPNNEDACEIREYILAHTVKLCDSGIFTREGATLDYAELFGLYRRMGVQYGIMIDVFCDAEATLASARVGLQAYAGYENDFRLVGVAQGKDLDEYVNCYRQLRQMGYEHVAIGGLLRRRANTVRFPYVEDESLLKRVLTTIRSEYPEDWLFALGCLNEDRLWFLEGLNVWADSKGWIFQYEKRDTSLNAKLATFGGNHLAHVPKKAESTTLERIRKAIRIRERASEVHKRTTERLHAGRLTLRNALATLERALPNGTAARTRIGKIKTHGLLDASEEGFVTQALSIAGFAEDHAVRAEILAQISANRRFKAKQVRFEKRLDFLNNRIGELLREANTQKPALPPQVRELAAEIHTLISTDEREYRFEQVRIANEAAFLRHLHARAAVD